MRYQLVRSLLGAERGYHDLLVDGRAVMQCEPYALVERVRWLLAHPEHRERTEPQEIADSIRRASEGEAR